MFCWTVIVGCQFCYIHISIFIYTKKLWNFLYHTELSGRTFPWIGCKWKKNWDEMRFQAMVFLCVDTKLFTWLMYLINCLFIGAGSWYKKIDYDGLPQSVVNPNQAFGVKLYYTNHHLAWFVTAFCCRRWLIRERRLCITAWKSWNRLRSNVIILSCK